MKSLKHIFVPRVKSVTAIFKWFVLVRAIIVLVHLLYEQVIIYIYVKFVYKLCVNFRSCERWHHLNRSGVFEIWVSGQPFPVRCGYLSCLLKQMTPAARKTGPRNNSSPPAYTVGTVQISTHTYEEQVCDRDRAEKRMKRTELLLF